MLISSLSLPVRDSYPSAIRRKFLTWVAGSVHCAYGRDSSSVGGERAGVEGLTVSKMGQKRSTRKIGMVCLVCACRALSAVVTVVQPVR